MEMTDLELKLLAAEPVQVGVGKIYHPTIREIIAMDESNYNKKLSLLLFDQKNIEGAEEEGLSNYQFLLRYCYHIEEFRNVFLDAFKMIFKEEMHFHVDDRDAFFYLGDIDRKIDEETMGLIQMVVKKANFIQDKKPEDEYNPGNDAAKKFIEKLKLNKAKFKPKEDMNLFSILKGLAWKSNSVNIFNVFDMTIYQLYIGFQTLETIDNYHYTLQGIYSGTVDGKNIKFDQIHWAKNQKK